MITLDTTSVYAYLSRSDAHYQRVHEAIEREEGPFILPVSILAELAYLIESRHGQQALSSFLGDIERGEYLLDCGDRDISRIRALVLRYDDMPLGFADAAVIACAERRGGRVLTYDQRHFGPVAREGTIQIVG